MGEAVQNVQFVEIVQAVSEVQDVDGSTVSFKRSPSVSCGTAVIDVESEKPSIEVEQAGQSRRERPGPWVFRWRVENKTEKAMRLLSVRVPHGKFKAEERRFLPPGKIAVRDSFIFDMPVDCEEPPDTIIENAFLILLVGWRENQGRVFVRLRIAVDHRGRPQTVTESITVQRVGFSGVSN